MIRLSVIGAGHWGPNLIANFHDRRRSEVAHVVDLDEKRRAAVAQRYPEIEVCDDAERAIDDPSVDAVVVATPTQTHFELARAALEAGKHVLVEKPMAGSVDEAEQLVALADSVDRILMVGHVFIFNGASQQAKRYLSEGELGRVYYLSMTRTNLGPIRFDVNAAWDLAAHDIALASYWLDAEPESVSALGRDWINRGIEDAVFATLRYPNDVLVHLHASWLHPRKTREVTVIGEKRMLTFDDMSLTEPLRIYDKQVSEERSNPSFVDSFATFRMVVREGDISIPKVQASQPLRNECDHFLGCIERGETPITDGREGLAVVRVLDAINRSIREGGREIAVAPARGGDAR